MLTNAETVTDPPPDIRPDLPTTPTMSVEAAGALFGLCRTRAYEEARRYVTSRGEAGLPAVAFGKSLRCPTALILRMLGLTDSLGEERAG